MSWDTNRTDRKKLLGIARELLFKKPKLDLFFIALAVLLFFYVGLAVSLNTARPLAPILTDSMEPYLFQGDLILIKSIHSSEIEEGDVIVFRNEILGRNSIERAHRVVRVEKDPAAGLIFWTKGDNREEMDGLGIPASAVRGVVAHRASSLGWVFMFFQSLPGLMFIAFMIFFYLIYKYGSRIAGKFKGWDPGRTDPEILERMDRQDDTMQEFREAIREHSANIRSHTGAVQAISDAAARSADASDILVSVVERLNDAVDRLNQGSGTKNESRLPRYNRYWKETKK